MYRPDAIRVHRLLMRIALSAGNIFAWIVIFQFFALSYSTLSQAFARTALLYALSQIVMCLLIPYAAQTLQKGLKAAMLWGILWSAAAFVFLGGIFAGIFGSISVLPIVCFAFFLAMYRAQYWIPYEAERNLAPTDQGSRLSHEILIALVPAFIGFMLGLGYMQEPWVFIASGVLMLFSIIPITGMPERQELFPWSYRETFVQLFSRQHRRMIGRGIIDGFQGAALLVLWPLSVFMIVGWSYPTFGAVLSLSLLFVMLLREPLGRWMQKLEIHQSRSVRAAIVMSAWVGRLAAGNPISVLVVDLYSHAGKPRSMGIDHWHLEQSSDMNVYVDEYTALRELSMGLGRFAACFLAALLALAVSIPCAVVVVFALAGLGGGATILFARQARPVL